MCSLLPNDILIAAKLHSFFKSKHANVNQFNPDSAAKFDISFNSTLPLDGAGSDILTKTSKCKKGYLLVSLGDCASCIRFDTDKWSKDAKKLNLKLVYFSGTSNDQIAKFRKAMHIAKPVHQDKYNALSRSINCYWNGRVYYYDMNWHLKWQMAGASNNQLLKDIPELLQIIGNTK